MLVILGCLCILVQLAQGHPSPKVTYDGHKVLKILHHTQDDYRKLLRMELQFGLDFWKLPKHVNDSMYVRVGPQHYDSFVKQLTGLNTVFSTLIEDVQDLLDSQSSPSVGQTIHESRRAASALSSGMVLNTYHRYVAINNYLDDLTQLVLPRGVTATVQSIGTSEENRDVKLIKISSPTGLAAKRGIFIDGGIHAREWVSPATVIYTIEQLAFNPKYDVGINTLLERYDVFLVPVVNPDGYEYSHTNERMWRKNRKINTGSSCVGVDLNRNFPFQWAPAIGGSTNPCFDTFSGDSPGSEAETANIVNFLRQNGQNIDAYLTVHSYGQMWLYPWGFTSALPADYLDLDSAALSAVTAIRNTHNKRYDIGSSTNVLYAAAGGSDDFAKGDTGIKYAYTIELRDVGRYGFALPTSEIIPTAEEFVAGLTALADNIYTRETGKK
ncbi:carboxypeptidase B-like [Ruditapes philippinarum]|uniref:carboxypeptidase B-like n=1 Tax=Ruditapes philippinarum TaxID=129788 RepID=UPI00295B2D19|nr:carboxypeptidase B-like [Ruditapes philippinarum]